MADNDVAEEEQEDTDQQTTDQQTTDHSPEAAQVGTSDGDGESS